MPMQFPDQMPLLDESRASLSFSNEAKARELALSKAGKNPVVSFKLWLAGRTEPEFFVLVVGVINRLRNNGKTTQVFVQLGDYCRSEAA